MVTFVPTPLGNMEDMTLRSLKAFQRAEVIFCEDTRVTKLLCKILSDRFHITIGTTTFVSLHSHNEEELLRTLDPEIFTKECVYVSDAGMPAISDPGSRLVAHCQQHGIAYDVLPGASAGVCAFAMSGFDATQHLFFGFLPHKGAERKKSFTKALQSGFVTVVYESPHRIVKFFEELVAQESTRKVFAVREMTKKFQTLYRGEAHEVLEKVRNDVTKGEWVIVLDRGEESCEEITLDEIISQPLSMKEKAKRWAEVTGKSPKECYSLIQEYCR